MARCIAVVAFVLSLLLPATPRYAGWELLLMGYMGLALGVVGWYANPVWLLSIVCGRRWPKVAATTASAAILLALTPLRCSGGLCGGNEYSLMYEGETYQIGYYVWLGSMLLCGCAALLDVYPLLVQGGSRSTE